MMLCPNCGKESNNLRVCAFCQAPYPTDGVGQSGTGRASRAVVSPRTSKAIPATALNEGRSRTMRWVAIGLLAAVTIGYYVMQRERVIPAGVVVADLIARPMSATEAANVLRGVHATTPPELRDGVLIVRIPSDIFPDRRDGQLALAQQYARADDVVQGRKRTISFLDPSGSPFAKADPATGVVLTR